MHRNDRSVMLAATLTVAIGSCPCLAQAQTNERFEAITAHAEQPEQVAGAGVLVYEGVLVYLGTPVDGEVDLVITAWDRPMGGAVLDGPTEYAGVLVENGWFRVELEPTLLERGRGFAWLDLAVRWPSGLGEYETLDGRQRLDFASVSFVPRDGGDGAALSDDGAALEDGPDGVRAPTDVPARTSTPISSGRRLAGDGAPGVRGGAAFDRVGSGSFGAGGDGDEGGGGRACDWTISGNNIYYLCGNVGVGTTNPLYPLHVVSAGQHTIFGVNTRTTNDFAYGVWGESRSPRGRGVLGFATAKTGEAAGVCGRSDSTAGRGVFGVATSPSGFAYGVWGESASTTGRGVLGFATAKSGANAGLYGRSDSTTGYGVYGLATATSGTNYGVYAETRSTSGRGVWGYSSAPTGGGIGVMGHSWGSSGRGVFGVALAQSGDAYGVYGMSHSSSGNGVRGLSSATSGAASGVFGSCQSPDGSGVEGYAAQLSGNAYGVRGRTDSSTGRGVFGWAVNSTGMNYGVYGHSLSTSGRGVFGEATAESGVTYGVRGEAHSSALGTGVHGRGGLIGVAGEVLAASGTTVGVLGQTASTSGRGVRGFATSSTGTSFGVYGEANSTSGRGVYGLASSSNVNARGVVGQATSPAVAVYAVGDTGASGTKAFEIDHPLDPANKYLRHYSTEAPEPINFYSGNTVLDEAGQAWVDLPDYFEAINRDFRYQLTTIGGWAPVFIALKVENNRFLIAGGQPGLEVSWRVEAIRNDAYVRAYGAPVEIDKPAEVRGRYIHPELFGQPREMGIYHHAAMPEPIETAEVHP